MISLDYYVVLWESRNFHFHVETVGDMLKRNRLLFAQNFPKEYIILSIEKSQDATRAAIAEFENILKLSDASERMRVLQDWPTEPIERPACPKCGKAMVWRMARNGTNAGTNFWGCLDYPICKGALNS